MSQMVPGTEVEGRYRLKERLGSGAMGVVYLAEDIWLGRLAAIKFVDPTLAADAKASKKFNEEARALAQIRHEHVVQVYTFGRHQAVPYFAMEYVAGVSLESIIEEHANKGTTVELPRAIEIIRAVGRGLTAVHDRRLVHRDVKPGNVVIEAETNRPVLVDFGLARRRAGTNPKMTTTAGTPHYIAPEQATDVDGTRTTWASDLYAFAASAFELLTGRPLFEGNDVYEVIKAHIDRTAPEISSHRPELAPFDRAFARALAKDPAARHESVAAFLTDLDGGLREITMPRSRRSSLRQSRPDALRVFLLEGDDALARALIRTADRALDGPAIERFTSAADLVSAFERVAADIVILDEETSASPITTIVNAIRRMRGGSSTPIIVFTRGFAGASAVAALGARELPKPINMHVLASALGDARTRVRRTA
jgi:serine/threonine-protein kinase